MKAKATQANAVNVITAPVDNNTNPGNIITGVAAVVAAAVLPNMTTKLLHGNLRSLNDGRNSILAPIEEDLLQFIFEYCKQGIQVTTKMIRKFVKNLMPGYRLKARLPRNNVFDVFSIKLAMT